MAEVRRLEAQGAVEINLVAQDLAHYGRDLRDGTNVATLLRRLLDETDVPWFRLLYVYSAGLREPLVELMATEPRLVPYLDMPIQHASDAVLQRMRRPERQARLREKIEWLRGSIPDLTLRTTVLVGFPGETEADFRDLLNFMEEVEFDRLGAFAFSPQDGTRAMEMEANSCLTALGVERLEELLEVQRAISADRLAAMVGRRFEALVDEEGDTPVARTWGQADDVDGVTVLEGATGLTAGTIVEAEITDADDYDLRGVVHAHRSRAAAFEHGAGRARRGRATVPACSSTGPRGRLGPVKIASDRPARDPIRAGCAEPAHRASPGRLAGSRPDAPAARMSSTMTADPCPPVRAPERWPIVRVGVAVNLGRVTVSSQGGLRLEDALTGQPAGEVAPGGVLVASADGDVLHLEGDLPRSSRPACLPSVFARCRTSGR